MKQFVIVSKDDLRAAFDRTRSSSVVANGAWSKFWRALKRTATINDVPEHPDEIPQSPGETVRSAKSGAPNRMRTYSGPCGEAGCVYTSPHAHGEVTFRLNFADPSDE